MIKDNLTPLSVSQLNRKVRYFLEQDIGYIAVTGELSNLSRPISGHYYFTLKDDHAQLRCVFFNTHHDDYTKTLTDGQQVLVQGKLSLYETRGEYQLIIYQIRSHGLGELYQQFEKLKQKLSLLGLFEASRKKPLLRFPKGIAIITSGTGAALQDILTTITRRYPLACLYIYPCEVQGKNAAASIIKALAQAHTDRHADVIILARGGGSIEDLWPFNNEQLAIAISNSSIPIVSGIGHETDFTIADFVADLRAATPTAAAEAATPDKAELLPYLEHCLKRLYIAVKRLLLKASWQIKHCETLLSSPQHAIANYWQSLDYLERGLRQAILKQFHIEQYQLGNMISRLHTQDPRLSLQHTQLKLKMLHQKLHQNMETIFHRFNHIFQKNKALLPALNPYATLERGYAIAMFKTHLLFSSQQVQVGDRISIKLAQGTLQCLVETVEDDHAQ